METDREDSGTVDGALGEPFLKAGVAKSAWQEDLCSKLFQLLLEDERKKYVSSM